MKKTSLKSETANSLQFRGLGVNFVHKQHQKLNDLLLVFLTPCSVFKYIKIFRLQIQEMANDVIPRSSNYRGKFHSLIELLTKAGLWCISGISLEKRRANAFVDRPTAVSIHPCKILVRDDLSPHTFYSSCPLTVPDQPAPRCILGIHQKPVHGPPSHDKNLHSMYNRPSLCD